MPFVLCVLIVKKCKKTITPYLKMGGILKMFVFLTSLYRKRLLSIIH